MNFVQLTRRSLCQSGLSLIQPISENPELCFHLKVSLLCRLQSHRCTNTGFADEEQLAPGEAQAQAEVHCLEWLLHRLLFCFVTNAVLHSNGMHDACLPLSVTACFSLLCHSRSSEQMESEGCVSTTENRLEAGTPREELWVSG